LRRFAAALALLLAPLPAHAALALNGARMGWPWALPFAGILLSIATGPLLFPKFWHAHYGKIAALWALLTLAPLAIAFGTSTALASFVHAVLAEYMSFIILLFALYVVAGGILITGTLPRRPAGELRLTPEEHRKANDFTWEPITEVAKLFAGIFVCIIPVLAMLEAGQDGSFAWLLKAVTAHDGSPHEVAYF
jgi:Na+/H+ antiporter NhaD/arsenite permease-like protein